VPSLGFRFTRGALGAWSCDYLVWGPKLYVDTQHAIAAGTQRVCMDQAVGVTLGVCIIDSILIVMQIHPTGCERFRPVRERNCHQGGVYNFQFEPGTSADIP
jgi:hypothetical protein